MEVKAMLMVPVLIVVIFDSAMFDPKLMPTL